MTLIHELEQEKSRMLGSVLLAVFALGVAAGIGLGMMIMLLWGLR